MSITQPQPLTSSSRVNRISASSVNADVKKKHHHLNALDERQKRAEAEGMIESLRRKMAVMEEKLATARQEVETAKKEKSGTPISDLESKFEELVKKYKSTKETHAIEISRLKNENDKLSALCSSSSSLRLDDQTIRDLRKAHALAEAENTKLRRELSKYREWQIENASLKDKIQELQSKVNEIPSASAQDRTRELQLEQTLEDAAEAFARLQMATVGKYQYEQTRWKLFEAQATILNLQGSVEKLKVELEGAFTELEVVKAEAKRARDERKMLEDLVDQLLSDRAAEGQVPLFSPNIDVVEPLEQFEQSSEVVDLVLNHAKFVSTHLTNQLQLAIEERDDLRSALLSTSSSLSSAQTELTALRVAHATLNKEYTEAVISHKDCAAQAAELREDVLRAEQAAAQSDVEAREARDEAVRANARAAGDREALKRANEAGMRWKSAKASMEDEVNSLREALREAYRYEEQYRALCAQYDELASREARAAEEIERIGQQNAQLIGHHNGDQRINYVESLRREMAMVKQELASTRQMLNMSNERKAELEREVAAYKSVDAPLIPELAQSTRTRVVRRAPEGSRLVSSTRSVSGRK